MSESAPRDEQGAFDLATISLEDLPEGLRGIYAPLIPHAADIAKHRALEKRDKDLQASGMSKRGRAANILTTGINPNGTISGSLARRDLIGE